MEVHGIKRKASQILVVAHRKHSGEVTELIDSLNPDAYYAMEDLRYAKEEIAHDMKI